MIYTVASTIPETHGGRTKSLLNRIKLYSEDLNVQQTILTTNYNANYSQVITRLQNRGVILKDQKIINLYDWLSNFNLLKNESKKIFTLKKNKQQLNIVNYIEKEDQAKNCTRYYDKDTGTYLLYRQYYDSSEIDNYKKKVVKFEDYFTKDVKHKVERWEYTIDGVLHRKTIYSPNHNIKLVEYFYDRNQRMYCKKIYENTTKNKLINIMLYNDSGIFTKSFQNEKGMFKYFFDSYFKDGDYVFNDARLLDRPLVKSDKKIKSILVFHSSHIENDKTKNSYTTALNNPNDIYRYYVLTNHQKNDIQSVYDIPDEKFSVIPHFIKTVDNRKPDRKNQFIFMGRFSEEKQIEHIIESYKLYKEKGYSYNLLLYGGVKGEIRNNIELLINKYNLKEYVQIKEFTDNPQKVFFESKASLLTSKFEGFPLSVMESINQGCPVIAYDIRYGPREIIVDGENGILVPKDDVKEFANAMMRFTDKPLENVNTKENIRYESAINNFRSLINLK